jgi:hypothetical protein
MSEQSRSDSISTTTWWSTSANKHGILDLLENELFSVIETTGIDGLTEQFTRWLRSISIELWHVDIIDEEDHLFTSGWTEKCLSLSFEISLKGSLKIVGGGLT